MATDSAGYNLNSVYARQGGLTQGLQAAAMYDPSVQSTPLNTSVAGTLNSQNNTQQQQADGTNNLQQPGSNAASYTTYTDPSQQASTPAWASLSRLSIAPNANAASNGTVAASVPGLTVSQAPSVTNAAATGAMSIAPSVAAGLTASQAQGAPTVVATGTNAIVPGTMTTTNAGNVYTDAYSTPASTVTTATRGGAAGINANQANSGTTLTDYAASGGSPLVVYRTSDGQYAYYQFNPQTSAYQFVASYNSSGAQTSGGQSYIGADGQTHYTSTLNAAQRGSAALQSLGAGQNVNVNSAGAAASQVTQNNNAAITAWKNANNTASANAQNTVLANQTAAALAYMQAHGGSAPPANAPGFSGQAQYSPEALAAAATQYQAYVAQRQAEDANAALLGQYANKPIDTAATDATSQAALNAQNSIQASSGGGADAGAGARLAANTGGQLVGQAALNHQTAAAQSYYTNMQAFGEALQAQASTDANATQTKLNSDIQNVQDVVSALEQNLSQLDATTQQRVQAQLTQLNQQIAQYQYAMQHYQDNTALVHQLAVGVLALGGAIATAATGGLAGLGIAAATTAATTAANA